MTAVLCDGNVLIALTVLDHVHHEQALQWFDLDEPGLATCPITEGTLLRFLLREGHSAFDAMSVLDTIRAQDWHEFWADSIPYDASLLSGVIGHRQVTDAYLVGLARHHQSHVATFDRGLAALHGPDVQLLST